MFVACSFPIRSCLVRIMPVTVHSIWSISFEVMIPEIIIIFYINCPSFILISTLFHPFLRFSISFEILNETKPIHHYINGNSCRINPTLNVLPPESIITMMVHFFLFHLSFQMWICEIVLIIDQGINWMPKLPNCSPLLNSFQQFISFVICFLISGTIMEFREWHLDRALYYGGFNLINFQYSTLDPIIFGYNNILMIFF